ncbi:MAG: hypothetical protein Q7R62_00615 [bacterium]|nr:hypothetical protein [bacterium]
MRYFINGFFFQHSQDRGLVLDEESGDIGLVRSMDRMDSVNFQGWFGTIPQPPEPPGVIDDRIGTAVLSDVTLTEIELQFNKRYTHRKDVIHYCFRKQADGTWVGHYESSTVGRGVTRCMLTPIPDDWADGERALVLSGEPSCHEWPRPVKGPPHARN